MKHQNLSFEDDLYLKKGSELCIWPRILSPVWHRRMGFVKEDTLTSLSSPLHVSPLLEASNCGGSHSTRAIRDSVVGISS